MRSKISPLIILLLLLAGCFSNGDVTPVDPNNPTPIAKPLWFVMVEDSIVRPPGSILADHGYWKGLESKGHHYAILDKSNPSAAPYTKYSDKTGLPCLILLRDADKKVLTFGKLPASTAEVDGLIKKWGNR